MRVLTSPLNPGGRLFVSLRHGPAQPERGIYDVSAEEVLQLAKASGLTVKDLGQKPDLLGRPEVRWHALELIRN